MKHGIKYLKAIVICTAVLSANLLCGVTAAGQPLDYFSEITAWKYGGESVEKFFTPGSCNFSDSVPAPFDVLGFNIGERYVDWNDVIRYMEALESSTGKVSVKRFGKSYEQRDFIQVCISSENNIANLEKIRQEHLMLTDASASSGLDTDNMPVVANLMASIHGNEASGVNSVMLVAYYLVADQGKETKDLLENTIIVITPGLNPDGINRFASWVNSTASKNHVADLNSREFTENWPSSRSNHYWQDCNRDWLSVQHPEGRNSMKMYLEWMPNVVLDMHEQGGTYKGFYFSPGDKNRTYKDTPQKNQDFTMAIARNTAKEFDLNGVAYYSKEGYDDYYIGKGAAYGDLLGSVAILHEQIASRGFLRPTDWGNIPFWKTVRNQTVSALSLVRSAFNMKNELLEYQRDFYLDEQKAAAANPVKGYKFSTRGDRGRAYHFIDNMLAHDIKIFKAAGSDDEYVIPLDQKKYFIIKSMWDTITEFNDSTFYDISTWTFPYAYNLEFSELRSVKGVLGDEITAASFEKGEVIGEKSKVAYMFEMKDYYAPYLLSELLKRGIRVRVAAKPFTTLGENGTEKPYPRGTVVIPASYQDYGTDELYAILKELAERSGVDVVASQTGLMKDTDFGSSSFKPVVDAPNVAIVSGRGMSVSETGEIWHLLDWRFNMNHTLIEWSKLTKNISLEPYNVIIFANGTPDVPLSEEFNRKLADWVKAGGTLIVTGSASSISNKCGLTKIETVKGSGVKGVILKTDLSLASPLFWGYEKNVLPIFKMRANTYRSEDAKAPAVYSENPYISGCISQGNLDKIAGTPAILVTDAGKGRVIFMADDLNFRSYWYGTSKILLNAILFRDLL